MTRKQFKLWKKKYCPKHRCFFCKYQECCYDELGYEGATQDEMIVVGFIFILVLFLSYCVCTGFEYLG